jgi:hypothetical protein
MCVYERERSEYKCITKVVLVVCVCVHVCVCVSVCVCEIVYIS